jgi:hypothetical protein
VHTCGPNPPMCEVGHDVILVLDQLVLAQPASPDPLPVAVALPSSHLRGPLSPSGPLSWAALNVRWSALECAQDGHRMATIRRARVWPCVGSAEKNGGQGEN